MQYIKPLSGKITSKFGKRIHPINGIISFHNGVDIASPVNTPIFCPASGKVSQLWNHVAGGKSLAIMADDGTRFGFAHLNSWDVKLGDQVSAGQIIAHSGNSGHSTGPHLHFTVKKLNQWVDPETYFNF